MSSIKERLVTRRAERQAQLAREEARVEAVHHLVNQMALELEEAGARMPFVTATNATGVLVTITVGRGIGEYREDLAVLFAPFGVWEKKAARGAAVILGTDQEWADVVDDVRQALVDIILKEEEDK